MPVRSRLPLPPLDNETDPGDEPEIGLVFDPFDIPTSIGTLTFTDVQHLTRAEERATRAALVKLLVTDLLGSYVDFEVCRGRPSKYVEAFNTVDEKLRDDLDEGRPRLTDAEIDALLKPAHDEYLLDRQQHFTDSLFRVTRGRDDLGAWMHSFNHVRGARDGIIQIQTGPVPAHLGILRDVNSYSDRYQRVIGEIFGFILNDLIIETVEETPRQFQIERLFFADIYGDRVGNINPVLVSELEARGVAYTIYANTPAQDAAGLVKLKHMFLQPERSNNQNRKVNLRRP